MEKGVIVEKLDNSKIELMKQIRKQINQLRTNLIILQSGNGGEIPKYADDAVLECRYKMAYLDGIIDGLIEYNK